LRRLTGARHSSLHRDGEGIRGSTHSCILNITSTTTISRYSFLRVAETLAIKAKEAQDYHRRQNKEALVSVAIKLLYLRRGLFIYVAVAPLVS